MSYLCIELALPTPSGRRDQQFVVPSLDPVKRNATFSSRRIQRVPLPIRDDEVGRENTERVLLNLTALTFPTRVDFSPHDVIEVGISDDDSKWMN